MNGKYVFLDRDGVINKDGDGVTDSGYVTCWEDFHFLPGVVEGIVQLNKLGFKCVVISNQQCVGKKFCSKQDIEELSSNINSELKKNGGEIAGFFYCFHRKEEKCFCRKPAPGLFDQAKKELNIGDISKFFYVGDTERDILAGKGAGVKTILVLSGKTKAPDAEMFKYKPDHVCKDFLDAVDVIVGEK